MIWIIASIPFWTVGAALFSLGIFGLLHCGLQAGSIEQKDFNNGMIGSFALLIAAGVFLFFAAKMLS
jgi:hypothetical protein